MVWWLGSANNTNNVWNVNGNNGNLNNNTVIATNRDGIDVANMDERAYNKLREIFREVVDVDYETLTYYVTHVYTVNGEQVREREARTRLDVKVNCMTFDDMVGIYGFSDSERKQAIELLQPQYDDMWQMIF